MMLLFRRFPLVPRQFFSSVAQQTATKGSKITSQAPITITPRAASRMKEIIAAGNDVNHIGVKLGVKRRGCNGYSYTMNYATEEDKLSNKFEVMTVDNLLLLLDKKAIFYVVGTEMDFEESDLASEFKFNNPNAKGSCGCGESFNV